MSVRIILVLGAATALLAGCGAKSDKEKVRAVLGDVADARKHGDAERACERDYAVVEEKPGAPDPPAAEAREECVQALTGVLAASKRELKAYHEDVRGVDVEGDEAHAHVHATGTRADGSAFARDITYELVRREGGWRVAISGE
jgi:ketosteroid isomerase-like protein